MIGTAAKVVAGTMAALTHPFVYSAAVLLATAVWVYIGRRQTFSQLALAMLFPAVFALVWASREGALVDFVWGATCTGLLTPTPEQELAALPASLVAAMLEVLVVGASASLALSLGWATRNLKVPCRVDPAVPRRVWACG